MITARKIAANRQNAQRSTGRKTANGKAKTRYNALKTGVYSDARLLPYEDDHAYRRLSRRLHKRYAPADPVEELLLDQMLGHIWLVGRLERAERAYLEKMVAPRSFAGVGSPDARPLQNGAVLIENSQNAGEGRNQPCSANCHAGVREAAIPAHEIHPLLRLSAQRRAHVQDVLTLQAILDSACDKSFKSFIADASSRCPPRRQRMSFRNATLGYFTG